MSLSGRQGGHQLDEPDEIEDPPQIVGERGQAEFGANLLQATHQKRALVHPLLDHAKRVFDRFATPIEDTRALREPRLHPVQDRLVGGVTVWLFIFNGRFQEKLFALKQWYENKVH
jgi:hypothetical protein